MLKSLSTAALAILACVSVVQAGAPVPTASLVVVAHPDTPKLDEQTLQRVYLGKVVEIGDRPIIPVNLPKGNSLRKAFMEQVLAHPDDKFIAYWTVRRYIGQGTPPREFSTVEEQIEFLRTTPGAVGYVHDVASLKPGLRVVLKKP
jgi:ABC-type phosphate transport system substrate-binding protein